ncbi:MAG TPA: hypothetical protein VMS93_00085 [Candidatus Saccharimonadales bacterium]|nr:hypothetical protein [Candidatus Saccharimonadales bacterium]
MSRRPRPSPQPAPVRVEARPARVLPAWSFPALAAAAVVYGIWAALHRAWVCDDAFISFRYAENLVRGLGLVFNPGERVEGYSNFLWTVWTALGMRLGADPEVWATGWATACYAATLALLGWNAWRMRRDTPGLAPWLPLAALGAAVHLDWNNFATGGLETSLYTLLAVLAYVLLASGEGGRWRLGGAGVVLGVASMTRPDGPLLAVLAGLFVLVAGALRRGRRGAPAPVEGESPGPEAPPRAGTGQGILDALALGAGFLALWLPFTAWRVSYYGDFFPNPYYAKSASIAWFSQGALYVLIYFQKYWVLALGSVLAGLAAALGWGGARRRAGPGRRAGRPGGPERLAPGAWGRRAALAALLALGYTAFVMRVGGDFMFARLLIPVTPFYLILTELALARLLRGSAGLQLTAGGVAVLAVAATPYPFTGEGWVHGIINEWLFYRQPEASDVIRRDGLALRPFFRGLPVRVAFLGGEARLMYYARPAVAIESQTGLTDRYIAHLPLGRVRGRVGHEKVAPLSYLIEGRRVHFAFHPEADRELGLSQAIPTMKIYLGRLAGRILTWDPALMDSLRRRGAVFDDFPTQLDTVIVRLPRFADSDVRLLYGGLRRFYFEHVPDPAHERPFLERLGRAAAEPSPAQPPAP